MTFQKGNTPWIKGKKHTDESRLKMRLANKHIGHIAWNKGKKLSSKEYPNYGTRKGTSHSHIEKIKTFCMYCKKELYKYPSELRKRNFCNLSHSSKYFYSLPDCNIRKNSDKNRAKGLAISHEKLKQFNWLHSEKTRNKLRATMKTLEFRKKRSDAIKGEKNPMWKGGRRDDNYIRLSDFRWKIISKAVRRRDNNTCRKCGLVGGNRELQIHHLIPWIVCRNNLPSNLITVCAKDHSKLEKAYKHFGFTLEIQNLIEDNKKMQINFIIPIEELIANSRGSVRYGI